MLDRDLKEMIENEESCSNSKNISNPHCVKLHTAAKMLLQLNSKLEAKSEIDKGTIF